MRAVFLALLLLPPLGAQARLTVFACEPEWAALTQVLAGDRAEVFSATTAQQDPHHIQARPSLIAKLRQADLLVCNGAELEIGWLPMLLQKANNARVQPGQPGHFLAAEQVELLDRRERVDRGEGDVHAAGNPHIVTDPHRILQVATALGARLAEVDPAGAAHYRARLEEFTARWRAALQRWEARAAPLKGKPIVVRHTDWLYLERWLGLTRIAALEPKPGVPPSSAHLAEVLAITRATPPAFIIYSAHQDGRPAQWLAERTGAPAVELPYTVGGAPAAQDLFSLFELTLDRLLGALK